MLENGFRPLRADEVECRVGTVSKDGKGCSLLLYKDARCDMAILDETVGPMGWMRSHSRDNANCTVSIWDETKGQWVSKEDTGTESNTEAKKGLASDSFKRACTNWGIGRELYTSPFIWIPSDKCSIRPGKSGQLTCYDKFNVTDMRIEDGRITALAIVNESTGAQVFRWSERRNATRAAEKPAKTRKSATPDTEPLDGFQAATGRESAPQDALKQAQAELWEAVKAYAARYGMDALKVAQDVKADRNYSDNPAALMALAAKYTSMAQAGVER